MVRNEVVGEVGLPPSPESGEDSEKPPAPSPIDGKGASGERPVPTPSDSAHEAGETKWTPGPWISIPDHFHEAISVTSGERQKKSRGTQPAILSACSAQTISSR